MQCIARYLILTAFVVMTAITAGHAQVVPGNPANFITIWQTDIDNTAGTSNPDQITIPTTGSGYRYDIYWENANDPSDNGTLEGLEGSTTITFPRGPGTYRIEIAGLFPRIFFNGTGDRRKILSVEQWGDIQWTSMVGAFFGTQNLVVNAKDAPDLSNVTSLMFMFRNASSLNSDLNHWDVSGITNMEGIFNGAGSFNGDISGWDVSGVTNMRSLFNGASAFNGDITGWDVSNVEIMTNMFNGASLFNQDIGYNLATGEGWDVRKVTTMSGMFGGASSFNGDISGWQTTALTDMFFMFQNATSFNADIGGWDVSGVSGTRMEGLFLNAAAFNQDLSDWDVSNVTSMSSMFQGASSFNGDISGWDVSSVTRMSSMFSGASSFNGDISLWNTGNLSSISGIFIGASSFNQDINTRVINPGTPQEYTAWDVSGVSNMGNMFRGASSFNGDISDWDTGNVTGMFRMFDGAAAFNSDIGGWDVSSVSNMQNLFAGASSFNRDLSRWDVSNVTNMAIMFNNASAFDQSLGDWNIEKVTGMSIMLSNSGLSTENYDATLIGWSGQDVNSGIQLGANGLTYCAEAERSLLISKGWNIVGDSSGDCVQIVDAGNSAADATSPHTADGEDASIVSIKLGDQEEVPISGLLSNDFQIGLTGSAVASDISETATPGEYTFTVTNTVAETVTITIVAGGVELGQQPVILFTEPSDPGDPDNFITIWQTDIDNSAGTSNPDQITIPTTGTGYDYNIYWESLDDADVHGTITGMEGSTTITFPQPGRYRVEITGSFPRIYFNGSGDRRKILSVEQWGDIQWTSMESAFFGTENLVVNANDAPDLGNMTSLMFMFRNASSLNSDLNHWDVSGITNMEGVFNGASSFNGDISDWKVSSVTDMRAMFSGASSFNRDISGWDVSNVETMTLMFSGASAFDQNIGFDPNTGIGWDVSNVTRMDYMFSNAVSFNGDISGWNTGNVTTMFFMFSNATSFNADIGGWDVSGVTGSGMEGMFQDATAFNRDVTNWEVSGISSTRFMFSRATSFNGDLSGWDTGNVTTMFSMFSGAESFNADIGNWNVSSVQNMGFLFSGASSFNRSLGSWDISMVTEVRSMLSNTGLSTQNYDATLTGWSAQEVNSGVQLGANGLTYCAETERSLLISKGWNIVGDSPGNCATVVSAANSSVTATSPHLPDGMDASTVTIVLRDESNQPITGFTDDDFSIGLEGIGEATNAESTEVTETSTPGTYHFQVTNVSEDTVTVYVRADFVDLSDTPVIVFEEPDEPGDAFITTWRTNPTMFPPPGASADNQIRIPMIGNGFNFTVHWGDGTSETYTANPGEDVFHYLEHTYPAAGDYQVSITGDFPRIYFSGSGDSGKILSVDQWGDIQWASMAYAFAGASRLASIPETEAPDLSNVESMERMFLRTNINSDLTHWDVSNVRNMRGLFEDATFFNGDISNWNVSNVTDMSYMFQNAVGFNGDIQTKEINVDEPDYYKAWDVSSVATMANMFGAQEGNAFNADISGWNTASLNTMSNMFEGAQAFDQSLGSWDVSRIPDMGRIFAFSNLSRQNYDATLIGWSTQSLQQEVSLGAFGRTYCAVDARDILISEFNWSIEGDALADDCDVSPIVDAGKSSVTVTSPHMADGEDPSTVTIVLRDESDEPVAGLTDGDFTVDATGSPTRTDISETDIPGTYIFYVTSTAHGQITLTVTADGTELESKPVIHFLPDMMPFITTWETTDRILIPVQPTGLSYNYDIYWEKTDDDGISGIVAGVTGDGVVDVPESGRYRIEIFGDFPRIYLGRDDVDQQDRDKLIDIEQWGDIEWESMEDAFRGARNLEAISATDAPDLSRVASLEGMFGGAVQINSGLGGWDVSGVTNMAGMFAGAESFNGDISGWNVSSVTDMGGMFFGATSFNRDIGSWDVSSVRNFGAADGFPAGGMFEDAASFDQDLSAWNISAVTGEPGEDMRQMLDRSGLSRENYDALLIAWAALVDANGGEPSGLNLGADGLVYCAVEARANLVDVYEWDITGDTLADDCEPVPIPAPLPPEILSLESADGGVRVTWQYEDEVFLSGFRVYKGITPQALFEAGQVPAGTFQFVDQDPDEPVVFYAVSAVNTDDVEGPLSNILSYFNRTITAEEDDWKLVSSPLAAGLDAPEFATVYGFDSRYELADELEPARGYWVKSKTFDPEEVSVQGPALMHVSLDLKAGWNLIGSLALPLPVDDIVDESAILTPAPVYGYAKNAYLPVDVLQPNEGYWIFADSDGVISLHIDTSAAVMKQMEKIAQEERIGHLEHLLAAQISDNGRINTDAPTIRIDFQNEQHRQRLWIAEKPPGNDDELRHLLPPVAPGSGMDIRTTQGLSLVVGDREQIHLRSDAYPVTASIHGLDENPDYTWMILLKDDAGERAATLQPGVPVVIEKEYQQIYLEKIHMEGLPGEHMLMQNYPNPFNPSTTIPYYIAEQVHVTIGVYDVAGRRVMQLTDDLHPPGMYRVPFDAAVLSSGVYLVRLQAGDQGQTRQITLIK